MPQQIVDVALKVLDRPNVATVLILAMLIVYAVPMFIMVHNTDRLVSAVHDAIATNCGHQVMAERAILLPPKN